MNPGYTEFYSFGCDYSGQLGHGNDPDMHDQRKFIKVPKSLSFDIQLAMVSCG